MLRSSPSSAIEADDLSSTSCAPWTRSTARRRCCRSWPSSSRPTRPSASRPASPGSARTGRTSTPTSTSCARACARAGRRRGSSRSGRSSSSSGCSRSRSSRRSSRRCPGRVTTPTASASATSSATSSTRRTPACSTRSGRVPRGHPRGAGPLVGARRRHALPARDPPLDHARHGPPRRPPGGPRRARRDRRGAARDRRRRGLRRRHRGLPAPLDDDPANQARARRQLVARCDEDIARAGRSRRVFGGCRGPPARSARSRRSRRRTRRSPTTSRRRRRVAARHLLRQHLRPAEPDVLEARARRPTTRRSRATTSRSASRWSTRPQRVPPARRADARRRLRRGLGPVRERLADELGLYRTPPSGSGCSTRRPGARRG